MDGRSFATNSQNMRPKGADILVNETARCPNPIYSTAREKEMDGRSFATNSQNMRPKGADILVNETAHHDRYVSGVLQ